MAQAPSLWGNAIDGFTNALSNPLTLGGLSLLSGGDLNQGIAAGTQLQKQAQQQRQMQAFQQGIQGMPNLTDNDRAILSSSPDLATSVLGEIYKNRFDPNAALNTQYKQAQIKKLQAEAADAGSTYGKAGTIVQGNDGKFYSVQFGSRGQRQILPLELGGMPGAQPASTGAPSASAPPAQTGGYLGVGTGLPGGNTPPARVGLSPAKGVTRVGDQLIDNATGQPVRSVAPNLEAGKFAEKTGELNAEGANNLPKAQNELSQSKIQNDVVNGYIDDAINKSDGYTSGFVGSVTSNIPGTKAYDLSNTLNTIRANLGFDKLQAMRDNSPTGGALGQVSEQENRLLQSTWGSVEQSQSPTQLKANLTRIKQIRQKFQQLKQRAYDMDVARYGKANVPDPVTGQLPGKRAQPQASAPAVKSGRYRYNPQTGDLEPVE